MIISSMKFSKSNDRFVYSDQKKFKFYCQNNNATASWTFQNLVSNP